MGDTKFTVIELHLDGDTQLGPATLSDVLGSDTETDEPPTAEPDHESDEDVGVAGDDSGRNGAAALVVALVVLVAIGVVVRKFRGDEEDESPRRDEPDVVVN